LRKLKILIVDDHPFVRKGISAIVDSEFEVCGEAADGKEAVEKVLALRPDLVLMDVSMPGMSGIEATRQIRSLSPTTPIIILSMHDSRQIELEAKQAGAYAYFTKTTPQEEFCQKIREALGGSKSSASDKSD
jgi:DNA-binding NarL/FixJ family response regulator